MIASFADLTIQFDAASCSVESGSITASFYQDGSEEASKIVSLVFTDGAYEALDITDAENPD